MPSSEDSTSVVRMRNVVRPRTRAPPNRPKRKTEAADERPKPLWLCGLDGGRWRTRTSDLVRVKQIQSWTARDYTGLSQEIVDLAVPAGTGWDPQPPPNRPQN